ncbi:PaaI family thioesterase (plasmid) [Sphingobium sp. JS3065]|uniref:PaaI family thioesterase n=1 Tax=Sphingobium sp. JS3065 TaxID=2970925 RepID=UPI0022652A15|nr:PaaI family thioesterase [Sphingobium sp. JS3065]UZW57849.1 PaaI family thioesterase [Sphingobium sp. JS3065]
MNREYPQPQLDLDGLSAFLEAAFPPEARPSLGSVVEIAPGRVRMLLDPTPAMARPGNIVSGPSLMALADVAAYAVIATHHGPEPMAVTHGLSISFLRACQFKPIYADARLLKLGRRLSTVDVRIWQGSEDRLVAQATVGYAQP